MSTHNIGFKGELIEIIFQLSSKMHLTGPFLLFVYVILLTSLLYKQVTCHSTLDKCAL